MNVAMILAGGSGTRVGANKPKQFVEIFGRPILAYTIDIYQKHAEIDAIEIVCHVDWIDYVNQMVKEYQMSKVSWIVDGGVNFQGSVINGMKGLETVLSADDIVMVQYGAAPFTSEKIVTDGLRVCREHSMSAACTPCYQLMATNDGEHISRSWVDRDKYVQVACPQSFRFGYMQKIYDDARKKGLIDNIDPHITSLMGALNMPIYQSYSDQTNIKITTKEDLRLFEGYVMMQNSKRI